MAEVVATAGSGQGGVAAAAEAQDLQVFQPVGAWPSNPGGSVEETVNHDTLNPCTLKRNAVNGVPSVHIRAMAWNSDVSVSVQQAYQ